MDPRAAADAYRSSSIENAPPIKIVRLLYQGALRFLDQAAREDPSDPTSGFLNLIGRADAIITELRLGFGHRSALRPICGMHVGSWRAKRQQCRGL